MDQATLKRWTRRLVFQVNGCVTWSNARPGAYGQYQRGYEHFVGPVPDGLELDHLCCNTACVRPDHLEPVTHAENVRRALAYRGSIRPLLNKLPDGVAHLFTKQETA